MTVTILHHAKQVFTGAHCRTFWSRLKGLMFSAPLAPRQCIVLDTRHERVNSIHMLFVFFPIDVIWADTNGTIVDIRRNVRPFTPLVTPRAPSRYIIETRANATTPLRTGDNLTIKLKNNHRHSM